MSKFNPIHNDNSTLWKRHTQQQRRTQLYTSLLKNYQEQPIHSEAMEISFLERKLTATAHS